MPIELAGRGKRILEMPYTEFIGLIQDVMSLISDDLKRDDYCFFGHSLGGKIAFELAQEIELAGLPAPKHVFISGRGAPFTGNQNKISYNSLSDEQFKKEILSLGGTPPEIFESQDLFDVFFPILRNDFKLSESENSHGNSSPISSDVTLFFGKDEDFTPEQITNWRNYTIGSLSMHFFNGGHFFINDSFKEIVNLIKLTLRGKQPETPYQRKY